MIQESNNGHPSKPLLYDAKVLWGLTFLFFVYESILRISPNSMVEPLVRHYHLSQSDLGHLSATYYYLYAPMQLIVGALLEMFGARRILALASIGCALGTFAFANGDSLGLAYLGRGLIGFSSSFAFVTLLSLSRSLLPRTWFVQAVSLSIGVSTLGSMLGNLLLAFQVKRFGWQNVNVFLALVGALLSIGFLLKTEVKTSQTKTTWAMTRLEYQKILRSKAFFYLGLIGSCLLVPTIAFTELWGPGYLSLSRGLAPHLASVSVSFTFLGWACGGLALGVLSQRFTWLKLLSFACLASFSILGLLLSSWHFNFIGACILMFALGVCSTPQSLVFSLIDPKASAHHPAIWFSSLNFFIMLGASMSQPMIGFILDLKLSSHDLSNYKLALSILPLSSLVALYCIQKVRKLNSDNGEAVSDFTGGEYDR